MIKKYHCNHFFAHRIHPNDQTIHHPRPVGLWPEPPKKDPIEKGFKEAIEEYKKENHSTLTANLRDMIKPLEENNGLWLQILSHLHSIESFVASPSPLVSESRGIPDSLIIPSYRSPRICQPKVITDLEMVIAPRDR